MNITEKSRKILIEKVAQALSPSYWKIYERPPDPANGKVYKGAMRKGDYRMDKVRRRATKVVDLVLSELGRGKARGNGGATLENPNVGRPKGPLDPLPPSCYHHNTSPTTTKGD